MKSHSPLELTFENLTKHLDTFEALGVFAAVLGIVMGLAIMFIALPEAGQKNLASSMQIFDVHEDMATELLVPQFVYNTMHEYLDQFYIAFTQTAAFPIADFELPKSVTVAYNQIARYADELSLNYQSQNSPGRQLGLESPGIVLGLSIDLSPQVLKFTPACRSTHQISSLQFPYSYKPPDLSSLTALVDNLIKNN